ncbi:esterase-like activity of phytase family protein [Vibrio sp. RC27]
MATSLFKPTVIACALAACSSSVFAESFNRIASFPVAENLPNNISNKHETSAEIIAASGDGNTLIYSDSPLGGVGFVDIEDPAAPSALGFLALDGEPTSVTAYTDWFVAGVNTSTSYIEPSGFLAMGNISSRTLTGRCDLNGQPDSVAISKDGRYIAVAIENERDEDLNDGELPQLPAGFMTIIPTKGNMLDCENSKRVELTGFASVGASDPEPEFVAFNDDNQIVLTLQENNHIAIIDANSGEVINHFSAGTVDLTDIDIKKDGALDFTGSLKNVAREPDSVKWLDSDRFVIANEGDYKGGARGFTIFNKQGEVLFESGSSFEQQVVRVGHYPDKRSGKKGAEPEGLEVASFKGQTYIFVLSERGSIAAVYRDTGAEPVLVQMLPSGIAPESAIAIPERGLVATANEGDLIEDGGLRSHIMLYQLQDKPASYPQIESQHDEHGHYIGWGALSGLAADVKTPAKLYAVSDSFYHNQPRIFTIDASTTPAQITSAMKVTRNGKPAEKLDLEGIVSDPNGGFWLASEGNEKKDVPHAVYHVDSDGEIDQRVDFPSELLKHQVRFGAEGIALHNDTLWVAVQRSWKDDAKNHVKLLAYNINTQSWGAVSYPLESPKTGWIGLSEITIHGDYAYILERDNQMADNAGVKRLYKVALNEMTPAAIGDSLPVITKTLAHDFLPELSATHGPVVDKLEGFTIDAAGKAYAVTDNDGVDDSSGETYFFEVKHF